MNLAWLIESPLLQTPRVTGSWGYQGLVDATYNFFTRTWTVAAPYPAFHTYRLTIRKLDGYSAVERLDLGESIYAYRFVVDGKPVYVLWREPGRLYFPDENEPAPVSVKLLFTAPRALITHIVTEIDETEPETETIASEGGLLTLLLVSEPVFVEAAR
jgi:hypothetical protein